VSLQDVTFDLDSPLPSNKKLDFSRKNFNRFSPNGFSSNGIDMPMNEITDQQQQEFSRKFSQKG